MIGAVLVFPQKISKLKVFLSWLRKRKKKITNVAIILYLVQRTACETSLKLWHAQMKFFFLKKVKNTNTFKIFFCWKTNATSPLNLFQISIPNFITHIEYVFYTRWYIAWNWPLQNNASVSNILKGVNFFCSKHGWKVSSGGTVCCTAVLGACKQHKSSRFKGTYWQKKKPLLFVWFWWVLHTYVKSIIKWGNHHELFSILFIENESCT